jgi:hypothetical protein
MRWSKRCTECYLPPGCKFRIILKNVRPYVVSWKRSVAVPGNLEISRPTMALGKRKNKEIVNVNMSIPLDVPPGVYFLLKVD